jgi:hypothetical protein
MKQTKYISSKAINKRAFRTRKSKLKRKLRNSFLCSWDVIEKAKNALRKIKHPHHYITRSRNYLSNKRVHLLVPVEVDYYLKSNYEINNHFLNQVKSCALESNRRVYLDFSLTTKISAAAMLSLLAEIDVITKKSPFGTHAISFNHPKDPKIESILKQVGFYGLLKKGKRETPEYDDVNFWKYTSGVCSEPILAQSMITEIKSELKRKASRKLYRGFVEAMSNSVEHAYTDDNEHDEEDQTAKWWTFAGIKDSELVVVICDKGVGIPRTLPKTQGASQLASLLKVLGYEPFKVKDSTFIKAATSLSSTRTGKSNRGKGLTDIKSVIDSIGVGFLSIFSNNGRYIYKGDKGAVKELMFDYKHSVSGTIIEWTIPLRGDE